MFWDSSAIVPCLVPERWSGEATDLLRRDPLPVIWWGTEVECASALERRTREGGIDADTYAQAQARLSSLCDQAAVVEASPLVKETAVRLLGDHSLRAADALQLAAALVCCEARPLGESFVCLDARLRDAAKAEGFTVLPAQNAL